MATALPAVELFSTSILSNHAVRKKHERYTSVLSIKKIPYVYHDMAMDEEAKKRWRTKARDQAIPGLLVHNEWRGTFAEFDEAVEFDELDMFLAIDHERLKREQALLAGNGSSSNGDGDSAASTSGADAAGAPAESGSNGTSNGNAGGAPSATTTTKYTGEAPPPFAPEGTGKRRSLDADDFLKALGIDESSLDVNDADLADMLNDSSLRSTNQATVETLRAGATSEGSSKHADPVPVPLNGLKGNAALGIGAAAAVRNAERKAQRGVVDGEKLKMDGLGPLAEGAPVELFTTSLLSNTGVRERHERFIHVLTSNQIHFRKYDLIADENAKKRWRAKSRDPQLPGVLVHGEWRGSYADFDAAARQGPDALVQWLNIDARLANASILAAREASSGGNNEEEEADADALAPKLNSNRFSLAIDDFLASLGVEDLTLGDADVDELLNGSGVPVVPGGEGAPVPPLRAAIPIQEREVIKEEDEEEEEEVEKKKGGKDVSEAEEAVVEEREEAMPEGDKAVQEHKEEAVPEEVVDDEVKTEEKIEDVADVEETAEKEETSEAADIKEEPEPAVEKVEESESAAVPTQEVPEEEEKEIDAVASTSAAEPSAPAVEAVEATASSEAEASEVVTSALLPATVEDEAAEKIEASDPTEPEPAETEVKATEPEVVEEALVAEPEPPSDVKPEEPEPEAAAEAKAEAEEPPPPPEKESEPSSSSPTTETTPVTSPGATMRKPRKSKSRTAVTDVMEETGDDFSPGRRGMDYQRPSMFDLPEPSPSMPFLSAGGPTSPILSDGGKNGASAMARSASAMSGLSGGKEARNRSGSGSAKRGLTSRLKFGKDKDKDRDKAPPGSPGLDESENGNGAGLASPLRARLSRDGSSGGIFKSRSRSPGPSSSKFKAKDRDVRGGPGGNAPPVPAMPRLVSGSVRAERTLSQILRDADAAMQMADAQMKGDEEEEDGADGAGWVEGDGLGEGSADEGDGSGDEEGADGASKAPDPFGKDQVTVDARS
ncbi:unnamed protein product [Tilletia controversa]|uniref:SH3 domain-containing protein n=3 Tax=Tilletia TaxID=13289 RepID=A0A8X7MZZ1_9BASI|nr:hypothetical protein CF336_g1101 [Tilletia laevis]KAE8205504.1 hypothetical protein CF328_g455 [Tilletia controversa]KAE8265438.1 hypothetical protein A4X03_0g264 [Tilletia caries]KAE8208160.1 hypothetical protein CF335_g623 [Tilletia laevis]KAE8253574.1 hypothetical protein A4X06_0g1356 [Tilletia controversa]